MNTLRAFFLIGVFAALIGIASCDDETTGAGENHIVHIQNATTSSIVAHYSQEHYDYRPFLDHLDCPIAAGDTVDISVYFITVPTQLAITWEGITKTFLVDIQGTLRVTENDFRE